jgi:hypothetical protein
MSRSSKCYLYIGPLPQSTHKIPTYGTVHYITYLAVWYNYAAALGPLGHWTLSLSPPYIALLYLHHPLVALARMKQFKSDYSMVYRTVQYSTDLEAGC